MTIRYKFSVFEIRSENNIFPSVRKIERKNQQRGRKARKRDSKIECNSKIEIKKEAEGFR